MLKISGLFLLAVAVSAAPHEYVSDFEPAVAPEETVPVSHVPAVPTVPAVGITNPGYHFSYSVNDGLSGDHKDHIETRDGDIVQGSYSLVEPDGLSKRVVDYSSDAVNGFNALVHNEPIVHEQTVAVSTPEIAPVGPLLRTAPIVHTEPAVAVPTLRTESLALAPSAVSTQTVSHTNHVIHPPHVAVTHHEPIHVTHHQPLHVTHHEPLHIAPTYHTRTLGVAPHFPTLRSYISEPVAPIVRTTIPQPLGYHSSILPTHTTIAKNYIYH